MTDFAALIHKLSDVRIEVFGRTCHCLSLDQLIAAQRAAGRPRDVEAIAELEIIRDRTNGESG